jgi:endonuclease YncB( thermonuclease family)
MMTGKLTGHRKHILVAGSVVVIALFFFLRAWDSKQGTERQNRAPLVPIRMDKSAIHPDDGDTFFYRDLPIRILGIDAPEIIHPEHGILEDQPYGREAAAMIMDIIRKAKVIEYLPFQDDKYGRLLAHVFVDGELLSVHLIRAGLAYENVSYYGDNGFPHLAEKILKAARESPRPPFEEPYRWRRTHQMRK